MRSSNGTPALSSGSLSPERSAYLRGGPGAVVSRVVGWSPDWVFAMAAILRRILLTIGLVALTGCLGMPESVRPVSGFELNNYLGKWYEVARLDHSFERGLTRVTAEYRMRDDGGVSVLNRGYAESENEWQEADGKAYFVESPTDGYLKVSFFGPFYGSYVVFELDRDNYSYAFVSGPNTDYLWLLSRTPSVEPEIIEKFIRMSAERGFDTSSLIYVRHDPAPEKPLKPD